MLEIDAQSFHVKQNMFLQQKFENLHSRWVQICEH